MKKFLLCLCAFFVIASASCAFLQGAATAFADSQTVKTAVKTAITATTAEPQNDCCRQLPVIMYHSVLKSRCGAYCLHPSELELDLKNLTARGYRTVTVRELIDYVENGGTLPEKPLLITFDDGHYNNLFYAYDILKNHHCTAVLNVIGCFSEYSTASGDKDHPEYSHLTWDEVAAATEGGVFEIGNHSYAMHAYRPRYGATKRRDESVWQYKINLREDAKKLHDVLALKSGVTAVCYAYPFGAYGKVTQEVIASLGYKVIFTCREKVNFLRPGDTDALLCLGRFNRDGRLSSADFLDKCGLK